MPLLTNSTGMITFGSLKVSAEGSAGLFQFEFECDGVSVLSAGVNVISRINSLQIVQQPPNYIDLSIQTLSESLQPIIKILDLKGNGV